MFNCNLNIEQLALCLTTCVTVITIKMSQSYFPFSAEGEQTWLFHTRSYQICRKTTIIDTNTKDICHVRIEYLQLPNPGYSRLLKNNDFPEISPGIFRELPTNYPKKSILKYCKKLKNIIRSFS